MELGPDTPCLCSDCGHIELLDEYEVIGADDGKVFCRWCSYEQAPQPVVVGDEVFEDLVGRHRERMFHRGRA